MPRPVSPPLTRKRGHINMCGAFATKSLERTGQSAISIANQLALYLGGKPGHCAMFRTNAQPNSWCLVWAHSGRGSFLTQRAGGRGSHHSVSEKEHEESVVGGELRRQDSLGSLAIHTAAGGKP